jgi:type IX secretion system PorP/SprF family membrane protein
LWYFCAKIDFSDNKTCEMRSKVIIFAITIAKQAKFFFNPLIFALFFCTATVRAQDLHYTQVSLQPLHYNPARTGIFQGNWRASATYRSQWTSVPVDYLTNTTIIEGKVWRREGATLNASMQVQQDQAGDAGLRWSLANATVSVAKAVSRYQAFSAGIGTGVAWRSVDVSKLTFRNQWTGDVFDPGRPSGESLNKSSAPAPSISAGINWHLERGGINRSVLDVGVGGFHLNRPFVHFQNDTPWRMPMRWAVMAEGVWQYNDPTDAVFYALIQEIGRQRVVLAGGGLRRWLNLTETQRTAIQGTLGWRVGDALLPAIQVMHNRWVIGVSYDVNISNFRIATNMRGGFELAAVYKPMTPLPVKVRKICPIF